MHTVEIEASLAKKGYTEGEIKEAIRELERLGYTNDNDFIVQFVRREERSHKSPRQILAKARMKGLPLAEVKERLSPQEETMRSLIKKKYPVLLDKDASYQQKQKARGALYRRGFYGRASCGDSDSSFTDECGEC